MDCTTIINRCDITAYRRWQQRRSGPAYLRGLPTWVWDSAIRDRSAPRRMPTIS